MLILNPLIMSAYSLGLKGNSTIPWFVDSGGLATCSPNPTVFSYFAAIPSPLARIFHESLSRDRETGNPLAGLSGAQRARRGWACHQATVPRYRGIGSEVYLSGTSQGEPVLSLSKEHPRTPGRT